MSTQDITVLLGRFEGGAVDQQGLGRRLLYVHYGTDLSLYFVFDVMALVQHEGDARPGLVRPYEDHFAQDAEQLVRVGSPHEQVVVGVKAAVEMEPAQAPEPQ